MPNEMIERVAKAIDVVIYGPAESNDETWKQWVEEAKAAIAAMREPTEEMSTVGALTQNGDPQPIQNYITVGEAKAMYRSMIDAALKE